ncbi:MAG: low molecular weight phosphatase family protein [Acutalibacteraceae bacterium]|jgi:protein-tyrosine-phosphatase
MLILGIRGMMQNLKLNEGGALHMNVLFVCTGNTCRSPMAAGIFKKIVQEKNLQDINILSAGISADNISKATQNAIKVCEEIGVDLKNHVSRSVFDVNFSHIDKFVVMTTVHRSFLINLGVQNERIFILGEQILDPFGGNLDIYEHCRDQIYNALCDLVKNPNFMNVGED